MGCCGDSGSVSRGTMVVDEKVGCINGLDGLDVSFAVVDDVDVDAFIVDELDPKPKVGLAADEAPAEKGVDVVGDFKKPS